MHDNNYGGSSNDEILLCKLRTNVRPVILAVKTKVMVDSFRDESTNANNDQLLSAIVERYSILQISSPLCYQNQR